jgi:hypothetical protein
MCPPAIEPVALTPPPQPKHVRYGDPALQNAYAYLVAALRTKSVPIYGRIFSEDEADQMAQHAINAVRALPGSAELKTRAQCALEPPVTAAVRDTVGRLLLGSFVFGLGVVVAGATFKLVTK